MKKHAIIFIILLSFVMLGCNNSKTTNKNAIKSVKTNKIETTKTDDTSTKENDTKKTVEIPYSLHGVPVLMYHSIAYEKGNPIKMPKEQFETEMKYIKENGYTTLTLDELYDYFQNSIPVPDKSIVITLDDGYADNYTDAFPILKKYDLKATIFIITSTVDKDPSYLTSEQMKEMESYGIKMASHTVTHKELNSLSYEEQYKELTGSKAFLENLLGRPINYIAYPSGKYNEDTVKAAKAAGYTMAFTTDGRWSDKSDGILTLDRVYISTFHSMSVFIDRLTNPNYKIN